MRFLIAFLPVTVIAVAALAEPGDYYHLPGTVPPPMEPPAKERIYPPYTPLLPDGAVKYAGTKWTQEIFQYTGGARIIRPFPIKDMSDKKWAQPGGLEGITGWKAEKFKYLPGGGEVKHFHEGIRVKTDSGSQVEIGIKRSYPVGTRFDEVLSNAMTGLVFEHRVREKTEKGWQSTIHFKDEESRPKGYTGLKVSCSACHAFTATGGYADGLVPGGDGIISDPLDMSLANAQYDPTLRRR